MRGYLIKLKAEKLIDLVYPRRCPVCRDILKEADRREGICSTCRDLLEYVKPPFCLRCGKHVESEEQEYCSDCQSRRRSYVKGFPVFVYNGAVKDSVIAFKYKNKREYADFYAREIMQKYGRQLMQIQADGLVPVPVHSSRLRRRGYNQAALLGVSLSRLLAVPCYDGELVRIVKTLPQKGLNDKERYFNLKKAFKRKRNGVKLEKVILVDDIYTSGSTIEACTEVLLGTGVKEVYYTSICIGGGR